MNGRTIALVVLLSLAFSIEATAVRASDESTFTTTHFTITYTTDASSPAAPDLTDANGDGVPDVITRLGAAFEDARSVEVDRLGYQPPVNEARYPVYVGGTLSLTQPLQGSDPFSRPAFTTITPSILHAATRDEVLSATAAHEYFHAIQDGYDAMAPTWINESSAEWIESVVTGDPNVALEWLRWAVPFPRVSMITVGSGHEYGEWIFFEFLAERYGSGSALSGSEIVKEMWTQLGASQASDDGSTVDAIDRVLKEHGSSFSDAWSTFLSWELRLNHFAYATVYRAALAGTEWPAIARSDRVSRESCALSADGSSSLPPLSGEFVRLRPARAQPKAAVAQLTVEGPPSATSDYVLVDRQQGVHEGTLTFADGVARASVPFGRMQMKRLTLIFGNASATASGSFRYSLRVVDAAEVKPSAPAGPSSTVYGTAPTVSGAVTCNGRPAPDAHVSIQVSTGGKIESYPAVTDATGTWTTPIDVPSNGTVTAFVDDPLLSSATSPATAIDVRVLVALSVDQSGQAGAPTTISGSVVPPHPGVPVQLEYRRPQGDWRSGPQVSSDASSDYSLSFVFPGDGVWEIRARVLSTGDADHLPGASSTRFVYIPSS
jgi:hypothetical protein